VSYRMRLRRNDGTVYLERWGLECQWFGVFVHRMDAPDPGRDLHDHPWAFWSIILKGGYYEYRAPVRTAVQTDADALSVHRRPWSIRQMRLDECHRIYHLEHRQSWSLVFRGPRRRSWGFYCPEGWVDYRDYDSSRRAGLGEEVKKGTP
jgi:hypothetical protein